MSNWIEPTKKQIAGYRAWVAKRPKNVRLIAERFPPWGLYRMKSTGHRVTVYSFEEHGDEPVTLKVNVLGKFNVVMFERQVFGIDPDDLEECEMPAEGEPVGAVLTEDDAIQDYVDAVRPHVLRARKANP